MALSPQNQVTLSSGKRKLKDVHRWKVLDAVLHPPDLKPGINSAPVSGEEKDINEKKMVSKWTEQAT